MYSKVIFGEYSKAEVIKVAAVIVDAQNDFCPGGNLAVTNGDQIVAPTNMIVNLLRKAGGVIVFTRDWHPNNHSSFKDFGGIWPMHCVRDTAGAEFHKDLIIPSDALIVSKAVDQNIDAYSGFQGTWLAEKLKNKGITTLLIGGLATEYCDKATVLDALKEGFKVFVVEDAIQAVNVNPGDGEKAILEMKKAGAIFVNSSDIKVG